MQSPLLHRIPKLSRFLGHSLLYRQVWKPTFAKISDMYAVLFPTVVSVSHLAVVVGLCTDDPKDL